MVITAVQTQEVVASSKIPDFFSGSKSVWRALTNTARGSESRKHKATGVAIGEIEDVIRGIVSKATPTSNNSSRSNALETLRRNGKTTALGKGNLVSSEVHTRFCRKGTS